MFLSVSHIQRWCIPFFLYCVSDCDLEQFFISLVPLHVITSKKIATKYSAIYTTQLCVCKIKRNDSKSEHKF